MAEASISPEVRAFLEEMKVPAVLATMGRDGGPITSAVWYGFDGDAILVSTPAAGTKAKNARRNPRVSFIVDTKDRPYRGVAIEGEAEVVEDPNRELVLGIARRYLGDELPPAVHERFSASTRVAVRIRPHRVRPWNLG